MAAQDLPDDLPLSFTTSMSQAAGLTRHAIRDLVAAGALERVARGIYRRADAPPVDLDLVEVALRAPKATLCLESALAHHDLTDRIPMAIDLALPRSQRQPATTAPVRWHRVHEETFTLGRDEIELEPGLTLGCYSAARTLAEVFRRMHREGSELAYKALRNWLRAPTTDPTRAAPSRAAPSPCGEAAEAGPRGAPVTKPTRETHPRVAAYLALRALARRTRRPTTEVIPLYVLLPDGVHSQMS